MLFLVNVICSLDLSLAVPSTAITLEDLEQSFSTPENAVPNVDYDNEEEEDSENAKETLESFIMKHGKELTPKQAKRVTNLVPKNMIQFVFNSDILTAGHKPILVCTVCGNEGHLQSCCPEENLPPLRPLPPLNLQYKQMLERVCEEIMKRNEPAQEELRDREQFMKELTKYIKIKHPNARLTVFGSSHNGFAFANSDLDISLTFENSATGEDLDSIEIIEDLAERLKKMPGVKNVQAITSAKVPIIKFTCMRYKLRIEGDISLYNVLAQRNTEMLRLYSIIDRRVRVSCLCLLNHC